MHTKCGIRCTLVMYLCFIIEHSRHQTYVHHECCGLRNMSPTLGCVHLTAVHLLNDGCN